MNATLVPVRAPSFAQKLSSHYRAVRARLGAPEVTIPALPPARRELILSEAWVPLDVIDRLAPPVIPRALPVEDERRPLLLTRDVHIAPDIIPPRNACVDFRGRSLSLEALQYARRRTIVAYLAAVRADPKAPRLAMIKRSAATAFKIDYSALTGPARHKALQQARQFAMCMARTLTTASLGEIGRAFGGRDHTTAHHAFKKLRPDLLGILADIYDGTSCEVRSWH